MCILISVSPYQLSKNIVTVIPTINITIDRQHQTNINTLNISKQRTTHQQHSIMSFLSRWSIFTGDSDNQESQSRESQIPRGRIATTDTQNLFRMASQSQSPSQSQDNNNNNNDNNDSNSINLDNYQAPPLSEQAFKW